MLTYRPAIMAVIAALIAATGLVAAPTAAAAVDIYITEGRHSVNGREWNTRCEKYSSTVERCRTDILATQVSEVGGRFVQKTGWVFNNLTYKASPRAQWKSNPLAANGVVGGKVSWTTADGRRWRTECDTAVTGNGGCRTWATARVIETYTDASGRKAFRWATREVFNNMVRFSAAAPAPKPTPTPTPTPTGFALTKISDVNLRECVAETLEVSPRSTVTTGQLASIEELWCDGRDIASLAGLPTLPNLVALDLGANRISNLAPLAAQAKLVELHLYENEISDLTPLAGLKKLEYIDLSGNRISNLAPLAGLTNLSDLYLFDNQIADLSKLKGLTNLLALDVDYNRVKDLSPLGDLTGLEYLYVQGNQISDVAPLAGLSNLTVLALGDNQLTDVRALAGLTNLQFLDLQVNQIKVVAPLASLSLLELLLLDGNPVSDLSTLQALVDAGLIIDIWPGGGWGTGWQSKLSELAAAGGYRPVRR